MTVWGDCAERDRAPQRIGLRRVLSTVPSRRLEILRSSVPAAAATPSPQGRRGLIAFALIVGAMLGGGPALTTIAVSETTPPSSTSENPLPPIASTGAASPVSTTATVTGTVTPRDAETTYQFEYGTSTSYGLATPAAQLPASAAAANVSAALTGLTGGTTYNYRLVATNAAGVTRGSNQTFTTSSAPKITSRAAFDVSGAAANVGATIDPNGEATTYRFHWGTTSKFGRYTPRKPLGSGTSGIAVVETLTGLKPNSKYYFRATATNSIGTVNGVTRSFTTPRSLTGVTAQLSAAGVIWGQKVTLTGSIGGGGVSGTKVSIMRVDHPFTNPAWQVGTATANSKGNYSLTIGPLYSTARFYAVTQTPTPLVSPTVTAGGLVMARLRVEKRQSKRYRLRGLIYPAVPSARISIQRQTPKGRWVRVKRIGVQKAGGNKVGYRTWVPRVKGRAAAYRAVILPRDGGAHVTTESPIVPVPKRK